MTRPRPAPSEAPAHALHDRASSSSTTSSRWPRRSPTGSPIAATTRGAGSDRRDAIDAVARRPRRRCSSPICACPSVDGLALLDAVRAPTVDVPVIVMTAYGAIDSAVESIRKGAYHYLTKPFKLDELALFVERALDERALRREATALRAVARASSSRSPG